MNYGSVNLTKYAVVRTAPLTVSGLNEIVASFEFKKDADAWKREHKSRWISYAVVKL